MDNQLPKFLAEWADKEAEAIIRKQDSRSSFWLSRSSFFAGITACYNHLLSTNQLANEDAALEWHCEKCNETLLCNPKAMDQRLEIAELQAALNKIGLLAMSEHAYTSEFTERVKTIVYRALFGPGEGGET